MKKAFLRLRKAVCIGLAAGMMIAVTGCGKNDKKEIDWVMPSTKQATPSDAESGTLTEEDVKKSLETEFPGSTATFAHEVKVEEENCYRFLVTAPREEGADAFGWMNDYYDVSESDGRILARNITDEKAEAIINEAFKGQYTSFTKTGQTVEVYGEDHTEYTADGLDGKIYISTATGNEVLLGGYNEETKEWELEFIAGY